MAKEILGTGEFRYQAADVGVAQTTKQIVREFTNLATATGTASRSVANFQKGTVNLATGNAALAGSMDKSSKSAANFSQEALQASLALGALSAGLAAVGKQMGEVAYQFDRNITLVKAVTGATSGEMQKLSSTARELGSETEFGASKAAEGLLVLSRMGLNAADSMQVLEPAMKLAQSQQNDMTATTELLIQQLRVFGKEVDQAASFANVMAATSSRTAADMEKLNLALSYAGPIAAATGRSFEEINAIMGSMFNAGIKASRAGTSLRFAMAALLGTTTKTEGTLKKIGLTLEDVSPTTNSFSTILKNLAGALRGVEDRAAFVFDLFGKRAAPAMSAVIEQVIRNRTSFDDLLETISDTDEVFRQFGVQTESFSGKLLRARSVLQELVLSITDSFKPAMTAIVDSFINLVKWLGNLPGPVKTFVTAMAGGSAVALSFVAALSSLVYVGGILSGALTKLSAGIAQFFGGLLKATPAIISATAAERAFASVLNTSAAAAAEKAIAHSTGNKVLANSAVQNALAAASEKTLAKEKWAVFKASMKQLVVTGQLTKAQAAQALSTANLVLHNKGVTAAMKGTAAQMSILQVLSAKLAIGFKALWTAIGGWFGLLMVAIPTVISLFGKFIADSKKATKDYIDQSKEMIRVNEDLRKSLSDLKDIQKDINNVKSEGDDPQALRELVELQKEYAEKNREVNKAKANLISIYPQILEGYDEETNSLTVNIDLLEKEIDSREKLLSLKALENKEIKSQLDTNLEFVDSLTFQIDKIEVLKSVIDEYLVKVRENREEQKRLKSEIDDLNEARDNALKTNPYAATGFDAKIGARESEIKKLEGDVKDYASALVILRDKVDDLQPKTDEATGAIEDMGEETDELSSKVQRLSGMFDRLINKYNNMIDIIQTDIDSIGMQDLAKKWYDLEKATKKATAEYEKNLLRINLAMKKAEKEGYDSDKLKKQHSTLTQLMKDYYDERLKLVSLKSEELADTQLEALTKLSRELEQEFIKSQDRAWNDVESQMKDATSVTEHEVELQKSAVNKLIESYQQLQQMANKAGKVELSLSASNAVQKLQRKLKQIEISGAQEIAKAKTEITEKYHDNRVSLMEDMWKSSLFFSREELQNKEAEYEQITKLENAAHEEKLRKYVELKEAQKDFTGHMFETIAKASELSVDALSAIGSYINQDLSEDIEQVAWGLKTIGGIVQGGAKGGQAGAIIALLSSAVNYIEKEIASTEKMEERRKEVDEYVADINRKQLLELQKMNKNFAELFRQVYGLGTSAESLSDIEEGFHEAASDVLQTMYAGGVRKVADPENVPLLSRETGGKELYQGITGPIKDILDALGLFEKAMSKDVTEAAEALEQAWGWASVLNRSDFIEGEAIRSPGAEFAEETRKLAGAGFLNILEDTPERLRVSLTEAGKEVFSGLSDFLKSSYSGGSISSSVEGIQTLLEASGAIKSARTLREDIPKQIADGIDDAELLSILEDLKVSFDEYAGKEIGGFDVIGAEDYRSLLDQILQARLRSAQGDEGVIKSSFEDYRTGLETMLDEFKDQLSPQEMIDLAYSLTDIPNQISEEISKYDTSEGGGSLFKKSAQDIVDAFNRGEKSFSDTVNSLNNLRGTISNMPAELRDELRSFINKFIKDFSETVKSDRIMAVDVQENIADETKEYLEDLNSIEEKYSDVVKGWNDLIQERSDVISSFEEEKNALEEESEKRLKSLEEERAAILGMFSFSETQNQRSKRFSDARKVEKDILDEIIDTEEALIELQESHKDSLARIEEDIEELKNKYGDIYNVMSIMMDERNDRQSEYLDLLDEESKKLSELTGTVIDLAEAYKTASDYSLFLPNAPDPNKKVEDLVSKAVSSVPEPKEVNVVQDEVQTGSITTPTFGSLNVGGSGGNEGNSESDTFNLTGRRIDSSLNNLFNKDYNSLFAAKGFEGIVDSPTKLTVGENFKPEYVKVSPISDIAKESNKVASTSITNIYINDNLDFRGAYGITDKSVAEEVYRKVWAPARRRNLDRFFNTRGKVIR